MDKPTPTTNSEKSKLYRQRNPERWKHTITTYQKKKYTCECGATLCNKLRPQHLKTRKHNERMQLINKVKEQYELKESSSEDELKED
jgi:hypothetical protein